MSLDRAWLVKAHMALAAFILPVAMLFVITGALYTWGIKGDYETQTVVLPLKQPMQQDKAWLTALAVEELNKRSLAMPSGKAKIKQAGNSFYFEWTGAKLDVRLEPGKDPFVAKLAIKKTSWHRFLVQLHKAKAGQAFKVYAALLAVGLIILFLTGFIMAWKISKYRRLLLSSMGLGLLLFMTMLAIS
jgi:hypothetical protein